METLPQGDPSIVIDGRQSYQTYGPWIWLSGSYPHPMGGDEQPESFKPFPDLHFDVSPQIAVASSITGIETTSSRQKRSFRALLHIKQNGREPWSEQMDAATRK